MKKMFFILCLVVANKLLSQTKASEYSCTDTLQHQNFSGPVNVDDEYKYFLARGINLTKYQYQSHDLNYHLNNAYLAHDNSVGIGFISTMLTGVGGGLVANYFLNKNAKDPLLCYIGVPLIPIGFYLGSIASKYEKKSKREFLIAQRKMGEFVK